MTIGDWLGGFFPSPTKVRDVGDNIWKRYGNTVPTGDDRRKACKQLSKGERADDDTKVAAAAKAIEAGSAAVNHLEITIDRQLNKATGVLSFNGLILAAISIHNPASTRWTYLLPIASSILILLLFFVRIGGKDDYESFCSEFYSLLRIILVRSWVLVFAIMMSLGGLGYYAYALAH